MDEKKAEPPPQAKAPEDPRRFKLVGRFYHKKGTPNVCDGSNVVFYKKRVH